MARPKRRIRCALLGVALTLSGLAAGVATAPPASAAQAFTAANAQTALTAFLDTYYNADNGLFYSSLSNHAPVDLWTSAYIRKGLCVANANTGGAYRTLLSDTYYGFENSQKTPPFTWTETIDGKQQTTTDDTWWGEGVHDANDDMLWNVDAAICAYEATGDRHMLVEAERNARYILETQLDSTPGLGDFGVWRAWYTRDYKDISTTGQVPYIAMALAKYFPDRTIYNPALGHSYTYKQYAKMTYDWVRSWIKPDGSILNGTDGFGNGYYDYNHYMMNVGLIADDAAAMYQATGDRSYISDAERIIDWGRNRFTIPYQGKQILWPQWLTGNHGNHYDLWVDCDACQNTVAKGIMSRGIVNFMQATGQTQYMQWMEDNADTAWANRHLADNVLYTNWQIPNTLPADSYASGNFTGVDLMQRLLAAQSNPYLVNAGFETDGAGTTSPFGWQTDNTASRVQTKTDAHSGGFVLTQSSPKRYRTSASQTVTGIPNGTYRVTAWVRGSGGQKAAYLDVDGFGGSSGLRADVTRAGKTWTQVSIDEVHVTNREATVTVHSDAMGGQWLDVDDVAITPAPVTNPRYTARNFSFEDDGAATPSPANWSISDFGNPANDSASFTEAKDAPYDARTGKYMLTHYKATPYRIYTYQTITGLPNGTYDLSVWVRSSGGQSAYYLDIKDFGDGADLTADMSRVGGGSWALVVIRDVPVTDGQATIGFYSDAGAGQWVNIDDVNLAMH